MAIESPPQQKHNRTPAKRRAVVNDQTNARFCPEDAALRTGENGRYPSPDDGKQAVALQQVFENMVDELGQNGGYLQGQQMMVGIVRAQTQRLSREQHGEDRRPAIVRRPTSFVTPTGTTIKPVKGGIHVDPHGDLRRRDRDAVISSNGANGFHRNFQSRFGLPFANFAHSLITNTRTQIQQRMYVAASFPIGIDDGVVTVILPRYLSYLLVAASILQGADPRSPRELAASNDVQGIVVINPLLKKFLVDRDNARVRDPAKKKEWSQVVVHSATMLEHAVPKIFAAMEYPGPAVKKAFYAVMMYCAMRARTFSDKFKAAPWFPFHGSVARIVGPQGSKTIVVLGASGAGKTENWFNAIYLNGVKAVLKLKDSVVEELIQKSVILRKIDSARLSEITVIPAGDDITRLRPTSEGLLAKNLELLGIFMRADGHEKAFMKYLYNYLEEKNRPHKPLLAFMNYMEVRVGRAINYLKHTINPRTFMPREMIPEEEMDKEHKVDVINMGIRCAPATADNLGLAAPLLSRITRNMGRILNFELIRDGKDSKHPSISGGTGGLIEKEGPGSIGGFIIQELHGQAFVTMDDVLRKTPDTVTFVLTASQNIGAREGIGFAGSEALEINVQSERSITEMGPEELIFSGHPLRGWVPKELQTANTVADEDLVHPWKQPQMGVAGWFNNLRAYNTEVLKDLRTFMLHYEKDLDEELLSLMRGAIQICEHWEKDEVQAKLIEAMKRSIVNPHESHYRPADEEIAAFCAR